MGSQLSRREAAPKLDWSSSKLGRIETAQQGVDVHGVRSMLDLYNVGGAEWAEILELTREARKKGWWHDYGLKLGGYVALEAEAATVHAYELAFMPGLLQTAGYARALVTRAAAPRSELASATAQPCGSDRTARFYPSGTRIFRTGGSSATSRVPGLCASVVVSSRQPTIRVAPSSSRESPHGGGVEPGARHGRTVPCQPNRSIKRSRSFLALSMSRVITNGSRRG